MKVFALITKSEILEDRAQPAGYRKIVEKHTRDDGDPILVRYVAAEDFDVEKKLAERVPQLEEQLLQEADDLKQAQLAESINTKLDSYTKELSDAVLKTDAGLTDEELAKLRS